MNPRTRITVALLLLCASPVRADVVDDMNVGLRSLAAALGVVMIGVQGMKWLVSDSPEARADAKKGLKYVLCGLLVVALAYTLVAALYAQLIAMY